MAARHLLRRAARDVRDGYLRSGLGNAKLLREDVALRFLQGEGIEIGAMDYPLRMPREAQVRYVDHLDEAGLRSAYAEILAGGKFGPRIRFAADPAWSCRAAASRQIGQTIECCACAAEMIHQRTERVRPDAIGTDQPQPVDPLLVCEIH